MFLFLVFEIQTIFEVELSSVSVQQFDIRITNTGQYEEFAMLRLISREKMFLLPTLVDRVINLFII